MPETMINLISSNNAMEMLTSDSALFVDVRSPLEFESEHIENSKNIPLDELIRRSSEITKSKPTVLVCRSGNRAGRAAQILASHGYDTAVLEGGVLQWTKDRLPLKEGKKRLSIERQTQLTIGIVLLGSSAAGVFVSKWCFVIPAFMGAGLTFAGLSGTCGLALLIAKAPWNKMPVSNKANQSSSCCSS